MTWRYKEKTQALLVESALVEPSDVDFFFFFFFFFFFSLRLHDLCLEDPHVCASGER
jgi:hypothetical protein